MINNQSNQTGGRETSGLAKEFKVGAGEASPSAFVSVRVVKRVGNNDRVADDTFEAFKAHAEANTYDMRVMAGFTKRCDVFGFINASYGEWINRGVESGNPVTQADIKAVDPQLFRRFFLESEKRGAPEWLYLPIDAAAAAASPISSEELKQRMAAQPADLVLYETRREDRKVQREATIARLMKSRAADGPN